MRTVRLTYSKLRNAGDMMNIDIMEKLGHCRVSYARIFRADMTAIGGALVGLQLSENHAKRLCQQVLGILFGKRPLYIWGSGFFHDRSSEPLFRSELRVCALRGALTRDKLEKLTGKSYDVPLADAGLLIDALFEPAAEKKYSVGLIPHMHHRQEGSFLRMAEREGVHLIDITDTPQNAAYEISLCETVASSSLHGLVFADALHIPNIHVLGEAELRGGNFKFEDYYSSYGLADSAVRLSEHFPTRDEIVSAYRIPTEAVEEKKKALYASFPHLR